MPRNWLQVYCHSHTSIIYGCIAGSLHDSKSHTDREYTVDGEVSINFRNYFSGFNSDRWRICYYKPWTGECRICSCSRDLDDGMLRILPKEK